MVFFYSKFILNFHIKEINLTYPLQIIDLGIFST